MNKYNIGRRIGAYREKMKLSTQELANRIKRSQATISRIENGKQGLTPELLTQIARELRVHPFALLTDEPLRHSILLPVSDGNEDEYVPNLLAFALHAGRVNRNFRGAEAAEILGVPPGELRMIEMGLTHPDDELFEKICRLYGLDPGEMRTLAKIDQDAPDISRRLACLQRLMSKVKHICDRTKPGTEAKAIQDIASVVKMADAEHPLPKDDIITELGLIVEQNPENFAIALQDEDFFAHMKELIKIHESKQTRSGNYSTLEHVTTDSKDNSIEMRLRAPQS